MLIKVTYPRLRVRCSQSTHKWYVVVQRSKYKSECIALSLTFRQACILANQIKHAFDIVTRPSEPQRMHAEPVTPGSVWKHYNGVEYLVMHIANMHSVQPNYVPTVVYASLYDGSKIWTRPLHDWHRSMRPVPQQSMLTGGRRVGKSWNQRALIQALEDCGAVQIEDRVINGMHERLLTLNGVSYAFYEKAQS